MPVTEAQARATAKYQGKTYDQVKFLVPKGSREEIQNHAASQNETMGQFLRRAVEETMARDDKTREE